MTSKYSKPSQGVLVNPFSFKISPMQKLLLIGFEKDPDEVYIGLEPQWFDDVNYGTGLRIIAWRRDGFVDVYQQPGLAREEKLDVAGKGLCELIECPMPGAHFDVTPFGVNVSFTFADKLGRAIDVAIKEQSKAQSRPFSLLAPVGSGSEKPSSLPAYFLYNFAFVRRANTSVTIKIGSQSHRPDTFPVPMNGSRVYFMRYSGDTFMVDLCPAQSGDLDVLRPEGLDQIQSGKTLVELCYTANHPEIKRISTGNKHHSIAVEFEPPFPNIISLTEQASMDGKFAIMCEKETGEIEGIYKVTRHGSKINLHLCPSGGWKPRPQTLFLRLLFAVAKVFRNWPKNYTWEAIIELDSASPRVISNWFNLC